jgi:hypothetical protein
MTSIKPPASGPNDSVPLDEGATAPKTGDHTTGGSFEQTLQDARAQGSNSSASSTDSAGSTSSTRASTATHQTGETPSASELAGGRSSDAVAPLLREMESGQLTMDQAVERLLDQTVQSMGAQLSGAQRAELSGLLRDALVHDPTLRALRDDRG